MPAVKLELNLGTLIPLAAMAIAVAAAWGKLTTLVETIDVRLDVLESSANGDDSRLRAVENHQSNMNARLEAIVDSIDELKTGQRETNTLLRDYVQKRTEQ